MKIYRYIGATTPIDLKNVVLEIRGDNYLTETVEVKFGDGNFTFTRAESYDYRLDRGSIDTVTKGDDVPMEISFGGNFDYVTGSSDATPTDALYKEGEADGWTSTADGVSGQECAPYCTDLVLINTPSCTTNISDPIETMTFPQFRADNVDYDVQAGTLSISGKCNATAPSVVRSS